MREITKRTKKRSYNQLVVQSKGQAAMEYLFVVGFAFALLLPIIILYYTQSGTLEDEVIGAQAKQAVDELTNAIDTIHFLGEPSRQTIKIRLPARVESATFIDNVIVLHVQNSNTGYDVVGIASANISGTLETYKGVHVLRLSAIDDYVLVEEQ